MAEGPELITNGDFASDVSSWTPTTAGNQTGVISWNSPGANLNLTAAWNFIPPMIFNPGYVMMVQSFTVVPDTDYIWRMETDNASSPTPTPPNAISRGGVGRAPSTLPFNFLHPDEDIQSAGLYEVPFTTNGSDTLLYFKFYESSNGTTTPNIKVDDVSVKEQNVAGDFVSKIMFF